ncbi:hillarin-like [Saccostrea echinata]|uniref:hillarin-like n=1 Tax=Saccostrea echinata TaxID=191078 RepID=UPI002A7FCCBE|nr:hillarin-like [Saccostrea echinata]
MGCGGSKEIKGEQPTPSTGTKEAQPSSAKPVSNGSVQPIANGNAEITEGEEEETGSDCLFISTDPGKETLKIDDEPQEYNHIKPSNETPENNIKKATNVKFFEDWFPVYPTETDTDSRPRTVTHIELNIPSSRKKLTVADIDKRARETPRDQISSFKSLKDYLLRDLEGQTDRERLAVRAIIVWLSVQDETKFSSLPGNEESPEGFLSLLAKKQTLFSTFFTVLCRKFGLTCVKVPGVSKAGDYQPGDVIKKEVSADNWAAVYFENTWNIVHPFWVCRGLFGHKPGGWIKLEAGGQAVGKSEEASAGVLRSAFKEYYIFPNPMEFIHSCHPDDPKWQISNKKISRKIFEKMPYLLPTFFGMGLKLLSTESCLLNTVDGVCLIQIQAPLKNANEIDLWYELYLKEGTGQTEEEKRMLQRENIPKLVAMIRCGDLWQFKLSLPIKGTFKICCYGGPYKSKLARIAEFRIDCKQHKKDCNILPFDPGRIGFGPGPAAAEAGFFVPSHAGGLVPVKVNTKIEITFIVERIVIERTTIRATLYSTKIDQTVLENLVSVHTSEESNTVHFEAQVPEDGEYALSIKKVEQGQTKATMTTSQGKKETQSQFQEKTTTVCNYLLSTLVKTKEKANQRNARNELQTTVAMAPTSGEGLKHGIENIENGIKRCMKQDIPPTDDQIVAAKSKLELFKLKNEVRNAHLRRNIHVTRKTIEKLKTSTYKRICEKEIIDLEEFEKELEKLNRFPQEPPTLHWAIGELANSPVVTEEIVNTVRAFLLLLGEPVEALKTWNKILDVIRPPAENLPLISLTARIKEKEGSNESLDNARLSDVQECLRKYTIDQVRNINVGAAVIYEWVRISVQFEDLPTSSSIRNV